MAKTVVPSINREIAVVLYDLLLITYLTFTTNAVLSRATVAPRKLLIGVEFHTVSPNSKGFSTVLHIYLHLYSSIKVYQTLPECFCAIH